MAHTLRRHLALLLAAGCLAALTPSLHAGAVSAPSPLAALFARYDAMPDGPDRDALAAQIDAAAHQKYASISRLYWHTDLAAAIADARESERPILHLRMLGKLDEDLSCANSRLFRATLYANQDVSAFLRENFVLYWSSERPVPKVTIDYGDGRKLEWTTTGNSAHYVLDEDGNVLDVLPGLYAPTAFRSELERSLALARSARGKPDDERRRLLVNYHQQLAIAATQNWDQMATAPLQSDLAAAQARTFSKAAIEVRTIRRLTNGLAPEEVSEDQVDVWSTAGRRLYDINTLRPVLDPASRALVIRLYDAVPAELRSGAAQRDAMISRLEQTIVADSAMNQLRLRPQIAREIVRLGGRTDFSTLNAWIYAEVFRTPARDPWLGLLPRTVFTGLPGDGVVITHTIERASVGRFRRQKRSRTERRLERASQIVRHRHIRSIPNDAWRGAVRVQERHAFLARRDVRVDRLAHVVRHLALEIVHQQIDARHARQVRDHGSPPVRCDK